MKKTMLIINGNAGQKNVEKNLQIIVPVLTKASPHLLILQTQRALDAKRYCELYGEEMDIVYILGGDGTVHECINGLAQLKKRPAVGILPGGTCNDFARTLGIPQNLKEAVQVLSDGSKRKIDVLQASELYFLNFWGIGLITETSNNIVGAEKAMLGKISYFLSAFRTVQKMDPFPVHLKADDQEFNGEAVMVIVANGGFIGTNPLPYPGIKPDDGKADVFILKNTNLATIRDLLTMKDASQWDNNESDLLHFTGANMEITTETPMKADTDGEVYSGTPETIKVLNQHLEFLVPVEELK
ncbi:YegS/Rv2252/BmrU family lipid kinase [Metabacillus sp. KIGAM252]|uniref:YegS/Rv2252/BmrU family lipid kinase n=1 Tax=Metabacillus flavus TaxID=2823519 RepID=A0ABS5LFN5_9BACI|nr:YegS/Rv2252/BmrU family lipid kinase [Metabacillus flavus]MBS2969560.1 YegS/Rv2252/BmrU family lipid kinase [Metabacillus flavus]